MRVPGLTCTQAMVVCVGLLTTVCAAQTEPRLLSNAVELQPQRSVLRNADELKLSLDVKYAVNEIFNPTTGKDDKVCLRSYNGQLAGETIRVKPGDTLRVDFMNDLPLDPCVEPQGAHTIPTCFNTTNLHVHGLHVSPAGNSDNVLLELGPGTPMQYEFDIGKDHPAGTFWYHPHRHGSTALQVASGMSGALIVEGNRPLAEKGKNGIADIDTILKHPDGTPFEERIFLFQQISYSCLDAKGNFVWNCPEENANQVSTSGDSGTSCPPVGIGQNPINVGVVEEYGARFNPGTWQTSGRYTSINGKVQPTLRAEAGKLQRWRMIDAGINDTIEVKVTASKVIPATTSALYALSQIGLAAQQSWTQENCLGDQVVPQWEIAADGLTRENIYKKSVNVLQPGYRSDVLVFFPKPGIYCIFDEEAPATAIINPQGRSAKDRRLLALVQVTGGTPVEEDPREYLIRQLLQANADLPPAVKKDLEQLKVPEYVPLKNISEQEVSGRQKLVFSIDTDTPNAARFGINHLSFNPARVDRSLKLNGVDEWTLTSAAFNHPFHIHVNPFQIERILNAKGRSIINEKGECTEPSDDRQYCDQIGVFRDTIFVKQGYQVIMRTRYQRYIGKFVLHCHILDHEDQGMMQLIEIVTGSGEVQQRHP